MQILHKMTASATLDSLTENRKWKETQLALNSPGAKKFFDGLRLLGVEIHSLPQLETLTKLQPDVAEEFLDRASTIGARSTEQLAALACLSAQALDISTTTLISTYPYTLCSKQDQGWVKVVLTITTLVRQMSCQCTAEDYLRALEQTDSRRHESRFRSSASFVGELSKSSTYAFLDANILRNLTTAHETFMSVGIQDIPALTPAKEIGKALRAERLHAIEIALASGV